ncbi:MAG: hypothetical protein ABSD62_00715 [Candidatus Limnocylindrales bacterium]|jgi:hypothetical protein
MTDRLDLSLIFGVGVVAEVLLLTLPGFRLRRIWRLALAVVAGGLGFLIARTADPGLPHVQALVAVAALALAAFLLLKNEILPRVSESSLLLGTLVLWYLIANVDAPREILYALTAAAVIPTAGTLVVAIVVRDWGYRVRLICYVWFLILSSAISILLLRFGDLTFAVDASFDPPNLLSLLGTGMCLTYLAASVFYIWTLVPFFVRGRLEEWWGDARLMASRFADYEMRLPEVAVTILVPGGIFLLNLQFRAIPVTLLASAILVLQRYGSRFLGGRPRASVSDAPSPPPS